MALAAQVLRFNTVCSRMDISRSTLHRIIKAGGLKTVKLSAILNCYGNLSIFRCLIDYWS